MIVDDLCTDLPPRPRVYRWKKHRGFTLLEVMVALVIFSVCAATLIQQSGRSIRQQSTLENRTQANWIAENELERIRLKGFPAVGKSSREIGFANQQWQIEQEVTKTNNADLRKVVIAVSRQNRDGNGYRLTGFLGRY